MSFSYKGIVPASKSVMNRALIVQSYHSDLKLIGDSNCDDVQFMKSGLLELQQRQPRIYCGEGGTTFRFLALRAAREPGQWRIEGTSRLLQRPQEDLISLLEQLGVKAVLDQQGLQMRSSGWQKPSQTLQVDVSRSSQFASSLILNAWNLPFDLSFELIGSKTSESYFQLTVEFLKNIGMRIEQNSDAYFIKAGQIPSTQEFIVESDLSSCFSVAAAGALAGKSELLFFPYNTFQPDISFVHFLEEMGVDVVKSENSLLIQTAGQLRPLRADLSQCPDLFPVLSILCAYADGTSVLENAPQLVHKESNRIQKVADLLTLIGVSHEVKADGMIIHGRPVQVSAKGIFDPDEDHRMVMAACLLNLKGHRLEITHPEAINKSFPEFLKIVGAQ